MRQERTSLTDQSADIQRDISCSSELSRSHNLRHDIVGDAERAVNPPQKYRCADEPPRPLR